MRVFGDRLGCIFSAGAIALMCLAQAASATSHLKGKPYIGSISPTSRTAGSGSFTLTVSGSSFCALSRVRFGALFFVPYSRTSTTLKVTIPNATILLPRTVDVQVVGGLGGVTGKTCRVDGTSGSKTFDIGSKPKPIITLIDPDTGVAGDEVFLTVTGSGFCSTSMVRWGAFSVETTFEGTSELTATIPVIRMVPPRLVDVSVRNSDVLGCAAAGTSNSKTFTITPKFGVSPLQLNFDPIVIGDPPLLLPLKVITLGVFKVTIESSNPAFSVSPETFDTGDGPEVKDVDVTFDPISAGVFDAVITVRGAFGSSSIEVGVLAHGTGYGKLLFETVDLPRGVVDESYGAKLRADGGDPEIAMTFDLVGNSRLPLGLELNDDTVEGRPTQVGCSTPEFVVFNGPDRMDTVSLPLDIDPAKLSINTEMLGDELELSSGTVDEVYSHKFEAEGGEGTQTWTWIDADAPPGLQLSEEGLIHDVPTKAGLYKVRVTVSDDPMPQCIDPQSDHKSFSITIAPAELSISTVLLPPKGTVDEVYSHKFEAEGGEGTKEWSWEGASPGPKLLQAALITGTPPGLDLSLAGLITGTPTKAEVYDMEVTVEDAAGSSSTQPFRITIAPADLSSDIIGVLNGAASLANVTPLGVFQLFLKAGTVAEKRTANSIPLPNDLGLMITVNGVPAPLLVATKGDGFDQVNGIVPQATAGDGVAKFAVVQNKALGKGSDGNETFEVPISQASPGIFTFDFGPGRAIVTNLDDATVAQAEGSLDDFPALNARPARVGDVITIWCDGLGLPDNFTVPDGDVPGPDSPLLIPAKTAKVTIGGVEAEIIGTPVLHPLLVGLFQINVYVPNVTSPEDKDKVPIVIEVTCPETGQVFTSRPDVTIAVVERDKVGDSLLLL